MEKNRAENLLKGSNEALMTLTNELKKIKKVLLAAVMTNDEIELSKLNTETIGGSSSANHPDTYQKSEGNPLLNSAVAQNYNMDDLFKRIMKFKHLEEDNKKLKSLLKDQLEKSDLLRKET